MADHKDVVDAIFAILDLAKDKIQEHQRRMENANLVSKIFVRLMQQMQFGRQVEGTLAGMVFDAMAAAAGDEVGGEGEGEGEGEGLLRPSESLDDFWLGVLFKVMLLYESKNPDKSQARVQRLESVFDSIDRQGGHSSAQLALIDFNSPVPSRQ